MVLNTAGRLSKQDYGLKAGSVNTTYNLNALGILNITLYELSIDINNYSQLGEYHTTDTNVGNTIGTAKLLPTIFDESNTTDTYTQNTKLETNYKTNVLRSLMTNDIVNINKIKIQYHHYNSSTTETMEYEILRYNITSDWENHDYGLVELNYLINSQDINDYFGVYGTLDSIQLYSNDTLAIDISTIGGVDSPPTTYHFENYIGRMELTLRFKITPTLPITKTLAVWISNKIFGLDDYIWWNRSGTEYTYVPYYINDIKFYKRN